MVDTGPLPSSPMVDEAVAPSRVVAVAVMRATRATSAAVSM